nr:Gfo/Idh/MocA family oxidoreductase [Rubricella aquisinus]
MRVAQIGAGYFARFQAEAWARLPGAALIGVADLDAHKAASLGPSFADAAEMLATLRPDIIDIATPPTTHEALIELALTHRPRAIICQKPFCETLAQASRVTRLAMDAGIPLLIHENFRFQPWYRALKPRLTDGSIGDLHQITFTFRPGDGQGPQAYLARQPYFQTMPRFLIRETGIHWVDTFRYLLGEPEAVDADLRRMNPAIAGEDAGRFTFRYANGLRAVFDGNRCLDFPSDDPRLTFGTLLAEGTGGAIRLAADGALLLRRVGEAAEETLLPPTPPRGFAGDCVAAFQAHVIAGLTEGATIETHASAYLRNLEIEEALYRADATEQVVRL